jgi:hypothetical protein
MGADRRQQVLLLLLIVLRLVFFLRVHDSDCPPQMNSVALPASTAPR